MPTQAKITLTQLDSLYEKAHKMTRTCLIMELYLEDPDMFDTDDEHELAEQLDLRDEALDDSETDDEDYHIQVIGYTNQGLPITYQAPEAEEEREDDPYTWSHERMIRFRQWVHCENDLREQQGLPLYSIHPGFNGQPVLRLNEHFFSGLLNENSE